MKSQRNELLYKELLSRFGQQTAAAYQLGISEPRLSKIINWRARPSRTERTKLEAALGAALLGRLIGKAAQ